MNHRHTMNTSPKKTDPPIPTNSTSVCKSSGGVTDSDKVTSSRLMGRDISFKATKMPSSGKDPSRIRRSPRRINRRYEEKSQKVESLTSDAVSSSSSTSTDKCLVSDDDDDSVSNRSRDSKDSSEKLTVLVSAPPPLTPKPVKLNTSQVHSKKYPFPHKLFDLLAKASSDCESSEIVSWTPNGKTFIVHNHSRFAAEFLPTYFGHTQFRSFDRQLNYWGFELVSPRTINNKSFGGKSWKHPFFRKDRRDLLQQVIRKVPGGSSSSRRMISSYKGTKSRPAIRTACKARTRVETHDRRYTVHPIGMDNRMHIANTLNNISTTLILPPRMVSPVHGRRCVEGIRRPVREIIFSAMDVVEQNFDGQRSAAPVIGKRTALANIEDTFLPLFPLSMLDGESNHKQRLGAAEPTDATTFSTFVDDNAAMEGRSGNDGESCEQVDIFEGNGFHDIDFTMDMSIDMDIEDMGTIIDETELLLDIVEDIENSNDDGCFSPLLKKNSP